MRRKDMLLGGPGLDGYAYCADVYCVECGQAIIRALPDREYDDLEASDTETVPVPIFFGESDTAQYCADCGEYLYGLQEGARKHDCQELHKGRAGESARSGEREV